MERIVEGTGVALITPFADDGSVDYVALQKQLTRVLLCQADFLVALGTTAETPTLESEEQEKILEYLFENTPTDFPIWVGCGGNNTHAVARRMQVWADRYPLKGFLSVSPYYNRPTQEGLFRHFQFLAELSPKPLLLYNVPARTGRALLPETVIRLAQQCPNIIGIKEASGDLSPGLDILQEVSKEFVVLSGDDKLALAACSVGYRGCISVVANLFPHSFSLMLRHALTHNNHLLEALALQEQIYPFYDLLFEEGNPTGIKAALSLIGVCQPDVRLPLVPASTSLTQRIASTLLSVSPSIIAQNHIDISFLSSSED